MRTMTRIGKNSVKALLAVCFSLLLAACSENAIDPAQLNKTTQNRPMSPAQVTLEGDDSVQVRVNGSPISRYDLEQAIASSLGDRTAAGLTPEQRHIVLESLVASRAIAQAQESRLDPSELAALEKKVQAYREQLLVKYYLAAETKIEPVTRDMVVAYYNRHPERFGASSIRIFEMISSQTAVDTALRDRLIRELEQAGTKENWQQWVKDLQQQGFALRYRKGQVTEKALDPRLRQLIAPLNKGESSNLSFIKGKLYMVRILDDRQIAPRPLADVSAEIRKALVPVQLKKAVKQASAQVLEKANVVYEERDQAE